MKMFSIAVLAAFLAGSLCLAGCDKTVEEHSKVTKDKDGNVIKEEKSKTTVDDQGNVKKTETSTDNR